MSVTLQRNSLRTLACALALCAAPALAIDPSLAPSRAEARPDSAANLGGGNWIDHFDSYATGSQMHGQGGWVGWDDLPAAGALTSSAQARSTANSVDILGATDLVQLFSGHTGTWTLTAWQYLPEDLAGDTFFIVMNTYAHGGPYHWSVVVNFDGATDQVTNAGTTSGSLPILYDQWVEIRVVIDLTGNTQSFFYGGQLLYSGSWTDEIEPGGAAQIAAIDLYANSATSAFYDDISLSDLPFLDGVESGDSSAWHATVAE